MTEPIIQEDADGIRYMLLPPEQMLSDRLRGQAATEGVIYYLRKQEGAWWVCLTDQPGEWKTYDSQPTFHDLVHEPAPKPFTRFVHLHTHTEFSTLDGYSSLTEVMDTITADGQPAVACADHGHCAAHPAFQAAADKAGVKPIFGIEVYFVPDRHRRPVEVGTNDAGRPVTDSKEVRSEYTHLTLWAMDDEGLSNLWAMSTESYRDGFYEKPRIDWDTLERLNKGIICGTGCLRGPVSRPLVNGDVEAARRALARLHGIFEDRLYVEIHSNHLDDQIKVNRHLQQLADSMGISSVAAVDSHYAKAEDDVIHQIWLSVAADKDLTDDTSTLFSGDQAYHLKTADEVRRDLAYLGAEYVHHCMESTIEIADRCTARISGITITPTYSKPSRDHPDPIARDEERVREICEANWQRKAVGKSYSEEVARARLERELSLYTSKHFCGYLLMVWDYVSAAKKAGCLVGPGRGSGGGSFVAYLMDITELDAIDYDLGFERFLTPGRTSLPDFDVDFPASWRKWLTNYVVNRWGEEYVARIGTTVRLQTKGAIDAAVRVLKDLGFEFDYMAIQALKALVNEAEAPLAGKHLPWEDFLDQFADAVEPLRAAYPNLFDVVGAIVGRVKTYGKHPAGVVISTDKSLTSLPMRIGDEGEMITQFDMEAIDLLGYVKFDLLTISTLDTIQDTIDTIRAKYGTAPNPYDWRDEYDDPQVWEQISAGRTLGMFQIETQTGVDMTKDLKPTSIHDLADTITLVRPGPKRSGLTAMYLRRRRGEEPVDFPDPRLAEVLAPTYGAMIYQEQVMAATMWLAGYNEDEADAVRKILGKKLVEKVAAAGEEFVRRAREHGMEQAAAQSLWDQMAEFAKYSFGKAHAYGYAVVGHWTGWFKLHYPSEFLAAAMAKKERLVDFIHEARRMDFEIKPPDINRSGVRCTPMSNEILLGLSNIKGVGEEVSAIMVAHQPYASYEDFKARMVDPPHSPVGRGALGLLLAAGAFDSLVPNRKAVEQQLVAEMSGEARKCVFRIDTRQALESDLGPACCTFDWPSEPDAPFVLKGRGKDKTKVLKPPPKRCTVACRQYRAPDPLTATDVVPYTRAEIREKETDLLGSWLTGSPFEVIPADVLEKDCSTADDIEAGPVGEYVVAAFPTSVRERIDTQGHKYAWISLETPRGTFSAIAFASVYPTIKPFLAKNRVVVAIVVKNSRGVQLIEVVPITNHQEQLTNA